MAIKYTAVKSSNVAGKFYDAKAKKLYIKFTRTDREYVYFDVSKEEIDQLDKAESFGSLFTTLIKNQKKSEEIW